jgi:hypothetical protein
VIRHAVRLSHEPRLFQSVSLWAAFEEALAGNATAAAKHLDDLVQVEIKDQNEPIATMTRLLLDNAGRTSEVKTIRSQLKTAFRTIRPYRCSRYVRDGYKRVTHQLRTSHGGYGFRLWSLWFYRGPNWLWMFGILPLVLLIPVAPLVGIVGISTCLAMMNKR